MNTKPSMTLRFLEAHAVFTFDEFMAAADPEVSKRTRETNLRNAILRQQAYRITRALYASNIGVYRDVPPNPLLVAGKAAPDAVLAYHSALEAHGVAHSPARVATFLSSRKVTPFDVGGYQFRRGPDLAARAGTPEAGVTHARVDDMLVPVTSPSAAMSVSQVPKDQRLSFCGSDMKPKTSAALLAMAMEVMCDCPALIWAAPWWRRRGGRPPQDRPNGRRPRAVRQRAGGALPD